MCLTALTSRPLCIIVEAGKHLLPSLLPHGLSPSHTFTIAVRHTVHSFASQSVFAFLTFTASHFPPPGSHHGLQMHHTTQSRAAHGYHITRLPQELSLSSTGWACQHMVGSTITISCGLGSVACCGCGCDCMEATAVMGLSWGLGEAPVQNTHPTCCIHGRMEEH